MQKRIIANICSGALASTQKVSSETLLHNQVIKTANDNYVEFEDFNIERSVGFLAVHRCYKAIKEMANGREAELGLFLGGKSHGAGKTWDLLRKKYGKYLSKFNKVAVVYVDACSRIVGDGSPKAIGKKRDLDRRGVPEKGSSKKIMIWNSYQRHKAPMGANMPTADFNVGVIQNNINHFNVVRAKATVTNISQALHWLNQA